MTTALLVPAGAAGAAVGWFLAGGVASVHSRRMGTVGRVLVAGGSGLLFVAVAARFGASLALPAYLYLAGVAVALALIDIQVRRLPNAIVLPSYLVGGLLLVPVAFVRGDPAPVLRALVAMVALVSVYCALALVYPGGMGFGDVKLAGLLGLYLGFIGWRPVWLGTLAGFLLGGIAAAVLLVTGRATRKTHLPFGPCMLAGALAAMFVSAPAWLGRA
jgi:leader peptidase (prepilin peptidase) / N-methyltransferase